MFEQLPNVPIRTWTALTEISGPIEGGLDDWPPIIQDPIYKAVEELAKQVRLPLAVVHASCRYDDGEKVDTGKDRFYIYIVVSEIVARDMRFSSEAMLEQAYKDIVQKRMR